MKKTICGSIVFLAGLVSVAILLASTIGNIGTIDGRYSVMWGLSQYGLMPAFYLFSGIAVVGAIISLWGLIEHN